MKNIILLLVLCVSTVSFGQYPPFDYCVVPEGDTSAFAGTISLGALYKRQKLGIPVQKKVSGSEVSDPVVTLETKLGFYYRLVHPKITPAVIDIFYEGNFSIRKVESFGSILVGTKSVLMGVTAGNDTRRTRATEGVTSKSEIGSFESKTLVGVRTVAQNDVLKMRFELHFLVDKTFEEYKRVSLSKCIISGRRSALYLGVQSDEYFGFTTTYIRPGWFLHYEINPSGKARSETVMNISFALNLEQ